MLRNAVTSGNGIGAQSVPTAMSSSVDESDCEFSSSENCGEDVSQSRSRVAAILVEYGNSNVHGRKGSIDCFNDDGFNFPSCGDDGLAKGRVGVQTLNGQRVESTMLLESHRQL